MRRCPCNGATGENIVWKVATPGDGHGSIIVWQDALFLVASDTESLKRELICLDAGTGQERWRRTVVESPLETKHALNSYASSTPATDGKLVYVSFLQVDGQTVPAPNVSEVRPVTPGEVIVAAYDFQGQQQWLTRCGTFVSAHGFCSNPVLHEDRVIINGDHDGESWIAALNKDTGEVVWRQPRPNGIRSYVTPIVRSFGGRTQLILSGSQSVVGLDGNTGETLWQVDGPTEQFVASMVDDGQRVFLVAGFPTYHVMAIDPTGQGNVTDSHVAWHETNAKCYVPSPVVVGQYLLVADDRGTANCFHTQTGERLWQARMGKHYHASLVAANGLVYFPAEDGIIKVVRPGAEPEIVAENRVNDTLFASPAVAHGRIYLRGEHQVYCLGRE
jgi:outer membrane protein assembly factor BamB